MVEAGRDEDRAPLAPSKPAQPLWDGQAARVAVGVDDAEPAADASAAGGATAATAAGGGADFIGAGAGASAASGAAA